MKKIYKRSTPEFRFWKYVSKVDGDCWLWSGTKNANGYGVLGINKKMFLAHRFSFELHKGKIPKGYCICHSCDVPACVNPKHLWSGTLKQNSIDMAKKGRFSKNLRKLTLEKVLKIRRLDQGKKLSQRDLGLMFGVTKSTISFIVNKKTWKYI